MFQFGIGRVVGEADQILKFMNWFSEVPTVYLHRDYVDFRKAINGLVGIIESQMNLSPYEDAIFVFCSKTKDKLKVIHWDKTGYVMWYKRLEQSKYAWPLKHEDAVIELTVQQWCWLLSGYNVLAMVGHRALDYGNEQAISDAGIKR